MWSYMDRPPMGRSRYGSQRRPHLENLAVRCCNTAGRLQTMSIRILATLVMSAILFGTAQAATSPDKIIISGASGQLGQLTIKALLARGVPAQNLILVSRTTDSLDEYAKQGAAVRFVDFTKPESLPA